MSRSTMTRWARAIALASLAVAVAAPVLADSRMAVLPGTVVVTDADAIPPGSILFVDLHDLSPGVPRDASVARQTFEVAGKTPIEFELPFNPSTIDPKRAYGCAAKITNSRRQALWETRVPIRVLTLGNQKKVQLVLRPSEPPKAPPEPTSIAVDCDGLRFHADLGPNWATVVLPESTVALPIVEAVAGKRYSDGAMVLTVSGSAAYFQRPGKAYRDCKVTAEPESKPKP
jgi:uncharacterized lipoprotein YbaY